MTNINISKAEAQASQSIKLYAGSAAAIGACPIPGSDAVLLTALQAKMINSVLEKFGVRSSFVTYIQEIVGARIVSMLGKAIVGNILKFIPGAGSFIGGAVNASVASSITYTLGKCAIKAGKIIAQNNWQDDSAKITETVSRCVA